MTQIDRIDLTETSVFCEPMSVFSSGLEVIYLLLWLRLFAVDFACNGFLSQSA